MRYIMLNTFRSVTLLCFLCSLFCVAAGYVSASSILGASQTELELKLRLSSFHITNFLDAVVSYVLPKQLSGMSLLLGNA